MLFWGKFFSPAFMLAAQIHMNIHSADILDAVGPSKPIYSSPANKQISIDAPPAPLRAPSALTQLALHVTSPSVATVPASWLPKGVQLPVITGCISAASCVIPPHSARILDTIWQEPPMYSLILRCVAFACHPPHLHFFSPRPPPPLLPCLQVDVCPTHNCSSVRRHAASPPQPQPTAAQPSSSSTGSRVSFRSRWYHSPSAPPHHLSSPAATQCTSPPPLFPRLTSLAFPRYPCALPFSRPVSSVTCHSAACSRTLRTATGLHTRHASHIAASHVTLSIAAAGHCSSPTSPRTASRRQAPPSGKCQRRICFSFFPSLSEDTIPSSLCLTRACAGHRERCVGPRCPPVHACVVNCHATAAVGAAAWTSCRCPCFRPCRRRGNGVAYANCGQAR
jgi:hypothetical protein